MRFWIVLLSLVVYGCQTVPLDNIENGDWYTLAGAPYLTTDQSAHVISFFEEKDNGRTIRKIKVHHTNVWFDELGKRVYLKKTLTDKGFVYAPIKPPKA